MSVILTVGSPDRKSLAVILDDAVACMELSGMASAGAFTALLNRLLFGYWSVGEGFAKSGLRI